MSPPHWGGRIVKVEPGMILLLLHLLNRDAETQTVIYHDVLLHIVHTLEHLDLQWDLADGEHKVRDAIAIQIIIEHTRGWIIHVVNDEH